MGKFTSLFPLSGLGEFTVIKKTTTVVTKGLGGGMPFKEVPFGGIHVSKPKKCKAKKAVKKSVKVDPKKIKKIRPKDTLALLSNEREPKNERMIIPTIAASILGALGSVDADAAPKQPAPIVKKVDATKKTPTGDILTHVVKKGDTTSEIAAKYGMKLADLKSLNPQIKDINKIKIGDKIRVVKKTKPVAKQATATKDTSKVMKPGAFYIPANTKDLLKKWEGLGKTNKEGNFIPYQDSKGVWTIGWGTTIYPNGTRVTKDAAPITKAQAEEYLMNYSNEILATIKRNLKKDITENKMAALISFGYNTGPTAVRKTIYYLNRGDNAGALKYMKRYVKEKQKDGTYKTSDGLVNRRNKEAAVWNGSAV